MEKLEKFYKVVNVILIVLMLSVEGELRHWLEETGLKEKEWLLFVVLVLILVVVFKILEWLIEVLVEKNPVLRKWILGNEYLEGVWCDRTTIDNNYLFAVLTISFSDGMYFVNGAQYYPDGQEHHSWSTIASKFDNSTMRLLYRSIYFHEGDKKDEYMGYSSFTFEKMNLNKFPISYTGKYKDFGADNIERPYKGYKIVKQELLEDLHVPEKQRHALQEIFKLYFGDKHQKHNAQS
ncbi:MAG: hypothetical protein QM764_22160 [Chitinophagaceae bacterium]